MKNARYKKKKKSQIKERTASDVDRMSDAVLTYDRAMYYTELNNMRGVRSNGIWVIKRGKGLHSGLDPEYRDLK